LGSYCFLRAKNVPLATAIELASIKIN